MSRCVTVSRARASASTHRDDARAGRDETKRRFTTTDRRRRRAPSTSSASPPSVDPAIAVAALTAWLRAHGAMARGGETTTFARSIARGVGGVATRDLDEGEVRRRTRRLSSTEPTDEDVIDAL